MNLCEGFSPGSRHIFRSYSTNNLDTKNYRRTVSFITDYTEHEEPFLKQDLEVKQILRTQESSKYSTERNGFVPRRGRCLTVSGHDSNSFSEQTMKSMKHAKSFSASKSQSGQQEQKKYPFKKFSIFDKKRTRSTASSTNLSERSEQENNQQAINTSQKIPLSLSRSLSSSCLSLADKSRPKLINRLSCPDSLVPSVQNTPKPNQDNSHRASRHGAKPGNKIPSGEIHARNVFARLKESFKHRNSREINKRNSQILVTRFELELAITKDDRSKLLTFINYKNLNLNAKDYYGKTLLHTASSVGNYQCAQILINAGAQVDIQDQAGFTPLHCAVVANHVPCAAVLIAAGADVMTSTRTMHTALTLAHEEEMILLIGRSLLLRGTLCHRKTHKDDYTYFSLRETKL